MREKNKPKVVFCWEGMSGYMVSCWKQLAKYDVELTVLLRKSKQSWDQSLEKEVSNLTAFEAEAFTYQNLLSYIERIGPDLVVICGWGRSAFRQLAFELRRRSIPMMLAIDTPFRADLKQFFARYYLRSYLNCFSRIVVAGERSFQYARYLGFSEAEIRRGTYAYDGELYRGVLDRRLAEHKEWPRKFLFIGRLDAVKAIDVLVEGYRKYRGSVKNPWELVVCGRGPLMSMLDGCEGILPVGFVQPKDLPTYLLNTGAFILTSRYEPWGVVIGEACASGLPVICTESCNAGVDMVRSYYNGVTIPTESPHGVSVAMRWLHERSDEELIEMGRRSECMAEPYSSRFWAERWYNYILEVLGGE